MKRFLASLAVLAVAALGLTGCTAGTSIVAGSQLSIAAVGELKSLNPDLAISQESDALAHELSQLTTVGFYYTNSDGQLLANEAAGAVGGVRPFERLEGDGRTGDAAGPVQSRE